MTPGYMSGFGNSFETEALPGALPVGRNSPQKVNYGLYAEQLSGSPFTAPQASNQRSWLYRIRPAVRHTGRFEHLPLGHVRTAPAREDGDLPLGQLRWSPPPIPQEKLTFVTGLRTVTTAGDADSLAGMASHLLFVTESMTREHFYNADGEFLIVAQQGKLRFRTEFGVIDIEPGEICVIPRGVIFRADLIDGPVRAYVCENYGGGFTLPDRGPIGANCLANPRDFLTPVAAYEDVDGPHTLTVKWGGELHRTQTDYSPLDVVAWHGNGVPYKYDLARFMAVNTVTFDHSDPSIFTVLTSPSGLPGVANCDFVIFPPRWQVAEHTFRPPWFHRNVMSELMGLVRGEYESKAGGFLPGGISIHNCMQPHGPDVATFDKASAAELEPHRLQNSLAFMWESRYVFRPTRFALGAPQLQRDYDGVWAGFRKHFR